MKKNKKKESYNLCFRYSNCKFCPRCAKCDSEVTKPKVEEKGKIINVISEFVVQVKEAFIKAWSSVKDILNKKISVRTKKYKKGKRYVHSYKKIKLADYIRLNE